VQGTLWRTLQVLAALCLNDLCDKHDDCCDDYYDVCGGDSGDDVTDQDLEQFSEKLFGFERPKALSTIKLNFGSETSKCGPDNSPDRLYNIGDEDGILAIDTIAKLVSLLDNYESDVHAEEEVTEEEQQEEKAFIDAVIKTPEMKEAYNFLTTHKKFEGSNDFSSYVHQIWFGLYDRDGTRRRVLDSSGFEHVFVGEIKHGKVSGQHNWVQQYLLEKDGNLNYKGFLETATYNSPNSTDAFGLTSVYDWNDHTKCIGGGLIGTTPELEMALATVCFMTRNGKDCRLSFNSNVFYYKTFSMRFEGSNLIGTAYPELSKRHH